MLTPIEQDIIYKNEITAQAKTNPDIPIVAGGHRLIEIDAIAAFDLLEGRASDESDSGCGDAAVADHAGECGRFGSAAGNNPRADDLSAFIAIDRSAWRACRVAIEIGLPGKTVRSHSVWVGF